MFLTLLFASISLAQFLPLPSGLTSKVGAAGVTVRFKEVPAGTCELKANVKSYSGYADVPGTNQSIFFWMFEARNVNPAEAPMTIRLDGGPGASSMNGLFQEVGPCTINQAGEVVDNPYSWTNASNMLFIDQPTQVGFSYSEPVPGFIDPNTGAIQTLKNEVCPGDPIKLQCGTYSLPDLSLTANTTEAAAPTFWKTLQGFMGAFPQYSSANNTVHIVTESYGGHYGPIFASFIQSQNELVAAKAPGMETAVPINLKTLIVGNGFYDARVQYPAYYNYTVSPGNTYDFSPFNKTLQAQLYNNIYGKGGCIERNTACMSGPGVNGSGNNAVCADAENFCVDNVENFFDINVGRDEDDIREIAPDPFPPVYYYDYLNTPKLQAAIGATTNWTAASGTVFVAFNGTGDESRDGQTIIIPAMTKLVQQGVTVALSAGDADYDSNWIGGEVVANLIAAPGFESAGYTNLTTSDGIVHGQVKQAGQFSFTRIYDAGHEAPFYQPLAAYEMFMRAITAMDIETGKTRVAAQSSYASKGTARSTFREGNSTILKTVTAPDAVFNVTSGGPNIVKAAMVMKTRPMSKRTLKSKFLRG